MVYRKCIMCVIINAYKFISVYNMFVCVYNNCVCIVHQFGFNGNISVLSPNWP